MAEKYEVVKPWHGVALGDVVELGKVHPSLKPHVRKLSDKAAAELVPATLALALTTKRAKRQSLPDSMRWALSIKATWARRSSPSCCRKASSKSFSPLNNSRL